MSLLFSLAIIVPIIARCINILSTVGLFFVEGLIIMLFFLLDLRNVLKGKGIKNMEHKRERITRIVYSANMSFLCFIIAYCLRGL